jgi:hypothetical protein
VLSFRGQLEVALEALHRARAVAHSVAQDDAEQEVGVRLIRRVGR